MWNHCHVWLKVKKNVNQDIFHKTWDIELWILQGFTSLSFPFSPFIGLPHSSVALFIRKTISTNGWHSAPHRTISNFFFTDFPFFLLLLFFCNRHNSFLSFSGHKMYNSEALPFTYDQYVIIELADKLYNCLFLSESMNFHPDKQLFQVASTGDWTTDPWITKPALYPYTMGDSSYFWLSKCCGFGFCGFCQN